MRPSIEVLRERHPLRVVYPFVGPHVLLFDHMANRQHHVLVARDEDLLTRMFEKAIGRQFGRRPVAFWKGTVVSAPPEVIDHACTAEYEDRVDAWWSMLAWNIEDYNEKLGAVPGVQKCTSYKYKYAAEYADADPSDLPAEENDEGHYSCANCVNGKAFAVDRYDFYEQHKSVFDAAEAPQRVRPPRVPKPFPLPNPSLPHDPAKPLYVVNCDGGHHMPGATISPDVSSVRRTPILFFQGAEWPIPEAIKSLSENALAAARRAQEREEHQRETNLRRRDVVRFKAVEQLFGVTPSRVDKVKR